MENQSLVVLWGHTRATWTSGMDVLAQKQTLISGSSSGFICDTNFIEKIFL